jgi:hypothetical protein
VTRREAFDRNERTVHDSAGLRENLTGDETQSVRIACECLDAACAAEILLTLGEYVLLRTTPEDFAVAPGHERPPRDTVVDVSPNYLTVEDQDLVPPHLRWKHFANPY